MANFPHEWGKLATSWGTLAILLHCVTKNCLQLYTQTNNEFKQKIWERSAAKMCFFPSIAADHLHKVKLVNATGNKQNVAVVDTQKYFETLNFWQNFEKHKNLYRL